MRGSRGTTLIELLVALVVTGVVALAAHATIGAVDDARTRADQRRERVFGAAAVRATVEAWVRGAALVPGAPPFMGRPVREGGLHLDRIQFSTWDGGALWPGPRIVRLRVDHDPATPERGLVAEIGPLVAGTAARFEVLELAAVAVGLEVRYQTIRDGVESWVSAWDSDERLPRAVSLRLMSAAARGIGRAGGGGLPPLLELPIVAPVSREGL